MRPVLLMVALASLGCRDRASTPAPFLEADSAGITITNSAAPLWTVAEQWTIDSIPLVDIGSAEGEEPYLLNGAESAWRTADGGIVFANTGSQQLRFFDSTGRFVRAVGRKGGGPGEYDQFSFMMITATPNGWVGVDERNRRVHRYDAQGGYLETIRIVPPGNQAHPTLIGVVGDDWITKSFRSFGGPPASGAVRRDSIDFELYRPDGSYRAAITTIPTQPLWGYGVDRFFSASTIPMTAEPGVLVDSLGLVVRTEDGAIDRWSAEGKQVSRHRWAGGERRLSKDFEARYWESALATNDSLFRRMETAFRQSNPPIPKWVATHGRLASGPDGTVWVEHFYFPWESDRRWDVLDRRGQWLGTVAMPARHWLYRAGPDWALAWHRDSLEVEHVTLHRLRRPSPR